MLVVGDRITPRTFEGLVTKRNLSRLTHISSDPCGQLRFRCRKSRDNRSLGPNQGRLQPSL